MPIDNDTLKAVLAGAGTGMATGVAADRFSRSGYAPPFMQYGIRAPGSNVAQFALDHPVAMPILRGLSLAIPLAVISGALKAGKATPDFGKYFGKESEDKEFWTTLYDYADDIIKEADAYSGSWFSGFQKSCTEQGVDPKIAFEKAAQAVEPPSSTLGNVWDFGKYFIPGLSTYYTGKDTLNEFSNMVAPNRTWKQRLFSGLSGLGLGGLTALSVIPGLGGIGAVARGLARGAKGLSKLIHSANRLTRPLLRSSAKLRNIQRTANSAGAAAAKGPGVAGAAARGMGFGRIAKPVAANRTLLDRVKGVPGAIRNSPYTVPTALTVGGVTGSVLSGGDVPQHGAVAPIVAGEVNNLMGQNSYYRGTPRTSYYGASRAAPYYGY